MNQDFTLEIGGEAGFGIMVSGKIFAKTCSRSGFFVCSSSEYPSLIRGGHNTCIIRVSSEEIFSLNKKIDFLIALNEKAIHYHKGRLSKKAVMLLNAEKSRLSNVFLIPLDRIARQAGLKPVMRNSIALGAALFMLQGPFEIMSSVVKDVFKEKNLKDNLKALKLGFDFAKKNLVKLDYSIRPKKNKKKIYISGNEAVALGAIKAGCKFFAAYPMTPVTRTMIYWAEKARQADALYFQTEDEISAVNSAIGASFAGCRAMTATSGGGFALMSEAYGLAGMTETPLVIIEGQRSGPGTGLPTWTEQGDLRFVLHAGHGDFPKAVLAPGDQEECFELTVKAFNIADKYQIPVIVLTDKYLGEGHKTCGLFDSKIKIHREKLAKGKGEFPRYKVTLSGISPRILPGTKGVVFRANSDEHDEFGYSAEESENRILQMKKRMKKLEQLSREMPSPKIYGPKNSKTGIIAWGSSKGPVLEAQKEVEVSFLHLNCLNPFPAKAVARFIESKKKVLLIDQNFSGQLAGLIREKTGHKLQNLLLKYDGRDLFPEEIIKKL